MKKTEEKIEHLEQYDYVDDSYIVEVEDKYAPYIGIFVMQFSALERFCVSFVLFTNLIF